MAPRDSLELAYAGLPVVAFARHEQRRSRFKRPCDCGCTIDGGEPYQYEVWKVAGADTVEQRRTCEPCVVDYAGSGGWYRST